MVKSLMLRIKVVVDHAGLSQLLHQLNLDKLFQLEMVQIDYQNNSLLIVQEMETTDVKEVLCILLMSMLKEEELHWKIITHTLVRTLMLAEIMISKELLLLEDTLESINQMLI